MFNSESASADHDPAAFGSYFDPLSSAIRFLIDMPYSGVRNFEIAARNYHLNGDCAKIHVESR